MHMLTTKCRNIPKSFGTHTLWKPSAACLASHVNAVTMVLAHGLLAPPVWGF